VGAAGDEAHVLARRRQPAGDAHIQPCPATDDPAAIGPVDIVLFATKLYDVESAAAQCKPLIGPGTAVISLLNGLDSEDRMIGVLGAEHVCGGVAAISSAIEAPGVIGHYSPFHNIQFGELPKGTSSRLERLLAACEKAGVEAYLRDDIRHFIWQKFIFLSSFAGIATLTRATAGVVRATPATRALLRDAIAETVALAQADGQDFDAGTVDATLGLIDALPPGGKPSMLVDLERGNRIEVEALSGLTWRMSEEKGLAAPVNRAIAAALAPYVGGVPAK
jgi:2-dehydropantoate 2-reductase